jgi:murein DD-endopeptidase MepM/ murein hydrolase activator NlpD
MMQEIAAADQRRLEEMRIAAEAVATAKTELEGEKTALEESKKELAASEEVLAAKRSEADRLLNELVAKGAEFDALLDEAEQKASEMDAEIDALEGQLDEAKQREYQQWLAQQQAARPQTPVGSAGAPNVVEGVEWVIPISYTHFSSPFGWRVHPVYGDWRFHYGVDLSAPSGTPIVATRSGVVSRASYDGSSGYHVYINHQDGFSTRYLHMTHYVVSPGDYVYAGQVIGYCGSTGTSTGPHLHFSVYYNGSAVNPAIYINI